MTEHAGLTGDVPDYTAMSDGEMVVALGDDGMKWAVAFCQMARKLGHHGIDEGWMVGWFASAIEHSSDVRRWERERLTATTPGLPQPRRKVGELPCGECHVQPGEVCDICGAST
jgi:hypothetical protein